MIQGGVLRRALGDDYRVVGLAFGRGAFLATDPGVSDPVDVDVKVFRSGPVAAGSVEETLEAVDGRDFFLDLRTAPAAARALFEASRPKREIGTHWPRDPDEVSLLWAADALVYLHEIGASRLLPGA